MRTLAIGDIHGCARALDTLLEVVAPTPDDLIITLGDYINRGPDARGVLERLVSLHATGRLVALLGNHELMLQNALEIGPRLPPWWDNIGGDTTLASYSRRRGRATFADIPAAHWHFVNEACVRYHETATHFFVHANADPALPLVDQLDATLFWERFNDPGPHCSGKIMVCGHTSQKSGSPRNIGHAVCIDTWAYGSGWLTCLDTTSGQIWQANEQGASRRTHLTDFE